MAITWFSDDGIKDIARVGGKGMNLGRMARAGLPVPPGFCVDTNAYRLFLDGSGLWPWMESVLASDPPREAGDKIRRNLGGAAIPQDVVRAVREACAKLGPSVPVAVRSSATAEDLAEASFAGQQETYLGVQGEEQVLEHVRLCWISLWTERSISYRQRNGFDHAQVALSVVVQQMVAPDVAGVLFTADPVSGDLRTLVANASYGLGESVVSGRVTPDTFRLSRHGLRLVRNRTLGTKATRIDMSASGGTVERDVEAQDRFRPCLGRRELRALAAMGERTQSLCGCPQDIEWAFAEGRLFLLQTRPITALGDVATARPLGRIARAVVDDILEHYPEPPYPLDHEAVVGSYGQLVDAFEEFGFTCTPSRQIFPLDGDGLPRIAPPRMGASLRALSMLGAFRRKLLILPKEAEERFSLSLRPKLKTLGIADLAHLDDEDLSRFVREASDLADRVGAVRFRDFVLPYMLRSAHLGLLSLFAPKAKRTSLAELLGGLEYKTAIVDRDLERLAIEAERLPGARRILLEGSADKSWNALAADPEGRTLLDRIQAFLAVHGARTAKMYLPFSSRSWAESPDALLALLAAMLRAPSGGRRSASGADHAPARDRLVGALPWFLRAKFLASLELYRQGHVAREATVYSIEEAFQQARRGIDEAARRLVERGLLAEPGDILFATHPELRELLEGSTDPAAFARLLRRRKLARPKAAATWFSLRRRGAPPPDGSALRGLSGSRGQAEGTARIVKGPEEFEKIVPGDVLVCPYTDPAWTPLFALACAVVSDTGGPLSHAAIVAREYGIPAVLGTRDGTILLQDGDRILVDGDRGIVSRSA